LLLASWNRYYEGYWHLGTAARVVGVAAINAKVSLASGTEETPGELCGQATQVLGVTTSKSDMEGVLL
jgi:hypothetical protein